MSIYLRNRKISRSTAEYLQSDKPACGLCVDACPHKFIRLTGERPEIKTMVRQDWCPVGDTIECGDCVKACPVYQPEEI